MAKKKIKTTKADFKYFKECCEYWMTELGIKDWHIDYDHCDLPDSFAEVTYTYSRRAATLCLSKDWTGRKVTRVSLDETACHEITHLAIAPLHVLSKWRFVEVDCIDVEVERLTTQMHRAIWNAR